MMNSSETGLLEEQSDENLSDQWNSELLSFKLKSRIYFSLVDLVKAEYPFDDALQDKAVRFLWNLIPDQYVEDVAATIIEDFLPSSSGSVSGFVESILTLLLSAHSKVVSATLSLLSFTIRYSSAGSQLPLVVSDLVANTLTTVQPHTQSILGNETVIDHLLGIIRSSVDLADASSLAELAVTSAIDKFNHREMIFQKVYLPSSQFVTFLISNRYILNRDLFHSLVDLLNTLLQISPFHLPTLEFVLASPIVMTLSSCLPSVENDECLWRTLLNIINSQFQWKNEGREVVQSGKRMIQALISEGFESFIEQTLMRKRDNYLRSNVVISCHSVSQLLGSNAMRT
ncbi:hypothetical protein BLNAU_15385 [Blattamonas nauphoetae]|uniref:Uncharacterized protein n=1 Tax=Blattamonas nauphoetae TaxID=2049346 RepID=A0ABQ9XDE5_9EUKA|nr:hypothetical protein BLNAU_15385 [Blattamonas nauphoetae]